MTNYRSNSGFLKHFGGHRNGSTFHLASSSVSTHLNLNVLHLVAPKNNGGPSNYVPHDGGVLPCHSLVSFGDDSATYRLVFYQPACGEIPTLKVRDHTIYFPAVPPLNDSSPVEHVILHYQQSYSPEKKKSLLERAWLASLTSVEIIARQLIEHGIPACYAEKEHLVSAGFDGFRYAADKYDTQRRVRFLTYAHKRIKGAMVDYLRDIDPATRLARSTHRSLEAAAEKLSHHKGHLPSLEDVLAHTRISRKRHRATVQSLAVAHATSIDTLFESSTHADSNNHTVSPLEVLDYRNLSPDSSVPNRELVDYMIEQLKPRQKRVTLLYYFEGLTMKEIGEVLGLSESRVCQIHSGVLHKLRTFAQRKGYLELE